MGRQGIIAALDVGTTKVSCFIAKIDVPRSGRTPDRTGPLPAGMVRIIGVGNQMSQGLRNGTVVDMAAAETTIKRAIDSAERQAGEVIDRVIVNVSAGNPKSHTFDVVSDIGGRDITGRELSHVIEQCRQRFDSKEHELIHALPTSYSVDGNPGIQEPLGMFADKLGVSTHFVTAMPGPLRNLAVCVERCHLELGGRVLSPYASALSSLVEDERDLGAVCVEMGGGTTSFSVFSGGEMIHADVLRIGGQHISRDIAQGLSVSLEQAERLKTVYGSALPSESDKRELIDINLMGEDSSSHQQIPRSLLTGIVKPRIEETFELVRDRLLASGFDKYAARRLVLTGGASQLNGVREVAARILDKQARQGRPVRISGLAESLSGPAFSTVTGLIAYAVVGPDEELLHQARASSKGGAGRISRMGRWIKENF